MTDPRMKPIGGDSDRLMEITLGPAIIERVLNANMVGEASSPLATEMHVALHHPIRERRQGFARLCTVAASPPAWGVLARWAKGRSMRVRAGQSQAERTEAREMAKLALRVTSQLDRLSAHPGYHGQAVPGLEPLTLPAYRVRYFEGEVTFGPPAPTPDLAVKAANWGSGDIEVGEMVPHAVEMTGRTYTCWIWAQLPAPTPLAQ
jgi:transposase InsO family protein